MTIIPAKAQDILKSATYNAISNLCNNLIFIFIMHYLSLAKDNPSLQQNGISVGASVISIIIESFISAFSQGLKIVYSQYHAKEEPSKNRTNNILLYQTIVFVIAWGILAFALTYSVFDLLLISILGYSEDVVEMSRIGILYIFVSKIILINYEFIRSEMIGLKVFGPFAFFQSFSFFATLILAEIIYTFSQIDIHVAGILFILHDAIKLIALFIYLRKNQKQNLNPCSSLNVSSTPLILDQYNNEDGGALNVMATIQLMLEERIRLFEMIKFIRPILLLLLIDYIFFNVSIILSGSYSSQYLMACACYFMTNSLIFKGVMGISESVISFCGTAFAKKDFQGVKMYLLYSLIILVVFQSVFILGIVFFSDEWARSFTLDERILQIIFEYKYFYFVSVPADGIQVLLGSFLQVIEMKNYVAKITGFSYKLIGIPLMLILGDFFGLNIGGIWLAIGIANYTNAICFYLKARNIDYQEQYNLAKENHHLDDKLNDEQIISDNELELNVMNHS